MAQGVLSFKYEEEKIGTGMSSSRIRMPMDTIFRGWFTLRCVF